MGECVDCWMDGWMDGWMLRRSWVRGNVLPGERVAGCDCLYSSRVSVSFMTDGITRWRTKDWQGRRHRNIGVRMTGHQPITP
jgi:hypothetical protein